jgi:DNA-binding MarR family transcriptional regulator
MGQTFRESEIYRLHEIVIRLDGYAQSRLLPPLGLTYPEFLVMMAVNEGASSTHGEVAAMLAMSKSLISQRVKALEGKKLLRQAVNAHNRREHRLELSPRGRDVLARAYDRMLAATDGVFASLGRERQSLRKLLEQVLDRVRDIKGEGPQDAH